MPGSVELPHNALIDSETGDISLPMGPITLNFTLEEWAVFAEIIDDITTVLQTSTVENVLKCPTCKTIATYMSYEEPSDKDVN